MSPTNITDLHSKPAFYFSKSLRWQELPDRLDNNGVLLNRTVFGFSLSSLNMDNMNSFYMILMHVTLSGEKYKELFL